jgi:hypothetical protein
MPLFSESEDRKRKKYVKWLQKIEKNVARGTRKLNCSLNTDPITPDSDKELLDFLHNTFGYVVDYGIALSGELHQCDFFVFLAFRGVNVFMSFVIPVQINWEAYYTNKSFQSSRHGWVCKPENKKRSRKMNRKFPRPIVEVWTSTGTLVTSEGGSICPGEGETTVLTIDAFCPQGKEAYTVSEAFKCIGDVVSLLNEWSS